MSFSGPPRQRPAPLDSNSFPPPPSGHDYPAPPATAGFFPPPPTSPPPHQESYSNAPLHHPQVQRAATYGAGGYGNVPQSAPAYQTSFNHAQIAASPPPNPVDSASPGSEKLRAAKQSTRIGLGKITEEMSQMMTSKDRQHGGEVGISGIAAGQFKGAQDVLGDDVGTFNGGSYRVSHRDTNTILTIQLAMGAPLMARPGTMIAMSHSVTLKGEFKFNVKKLLIGGEMAHSQYTGPGEILFAPAYLGDIHLLKLNGEDTWSVGKEAFLACTAGVTKTYKSQSFSKAIFSGEGLFILKVGGSGILWVSTFGAIIRKDLAEGERYIVDNGHLVAWNAKYVMERAASGGILSSYHSGEGLVCKFTGPGTIYMQSRNAAAFYAFMNGQKYAE